MYDGFDFLITLSFGIIYLRMTAFMMLEKQRKIKEVMRTMGMTNTSYYGSWILHEFLIFLVASLFTAGMVKATLPRLSFWVMLTLCLLYSLMLISQSLLVQVFFTRAKIAILFATFLLIFQYALSFVFKNSKQQTELLSTSVAVFPISAMALGLFGILQHHSAGGSIDFHSISELTANVRLSTMFISLSINITIWFLLFLYLEQVFPNEWGIKRHPLFLCQWGKSSKESKPQVDIVITDIAQSRENINYPSNLPTRA